MRLLCFQALDEEYLVVWHGFEKDPLGNRSVPWRYLKEPDLRNFLLGRIDDGYVFPINPKWILCDKGAAARVDARSLPCVVCEQAPPHASLPFPALAFSLS